MLLALVMVGISALHLLVIIDITSPLNSVGNNTTSNVTLQANNGMDIATSINAGSPISTSGSSAEIFSSVARSLTSSRSRGSEHH